MQDLFTKWVEIVPLRKATGKIVKKAFHDTILCRYGAPKVLVTDNGTEFVNKIVVQVGDEYKILHTTVPPHLAQANPVERVNRILKQIIIAFHDSDHRLWDEHLSEFWYAINTAEQSSTKMPPAFLNFGKILKSPNTIKREENTSELIKKMFVEQWKNRISRQHALRDLISKFQFKASEKQAQYFNAATREVKFNIRNLVWKRKKILSSATNFVAAKLVTKFDGPYRTCKLRSPVVVELETLDGKKVSKAHIKDLKLKVRKQTHLSIPSDPPIDEPVRTVASHLEASLRLA